MSSRAAVGAPSPQLGLEGFDPATGLALSPRFCMRVRDAASATSEAGPLVVGTVCVENFDALSHQHPAHALRSLHATADALREALPFVHSLGRTGEAELAFLLPNAGKDPDARAKQVVRAVAARLARDPALLFPLPLELGFGYAVSPRDGADAAVLLRLASQVRARISGRPS